MLGLDFHSTYHDVFYKNKIRKGTTAPNFVQNWFNTLEKNIPNNKVNEQESNSNKPDSKEWFYMGIMQLVLPMKLEIKHPKRI